MVSCRDSESLDKTLEEMNSKCPIELGGGLMLCGYYPEDDNVVAELVVNESYTDVNFISLMDSDLLKAGFLSDLDSGTETLLRLLAKEHKGLIIRFIGDTYGKTVELTYSADELQQAMKK